MIPIPDELRVNGYRAFQRLSAVFVLFALGAMDSLALPVVVPSTFDAVFATHVVTAVELHPSVMAAKMREQASGYRADGLGYFFNSPVLSASTGYAKGPDDMQGISLSRVSPADAVTFSGGVEAPVGGGIYAGAGAAERVLTESDSGNGSDLRQTAVGARARMPLLRDFKYGLHRHEFSKLQAMALIDSAERENMQCVVGRDALLAWIGYLRGISDKQAVESAVRRAEKLYEQTSQRAELKDVAGYQVFPTKYEVALRKEELQEAQQNVASGLETLRERLGLQAAGSSVVLTSANATNAILSMAAAITEFRELAFSSDEVLQRHPLCLSALATFEAARTELSLAMEKAKDSLDVSAGFGWRGETDSGFVGRDAIESSNNEVFEVGILWKRSLDKRGVRSDVAVAKAGMEAALAELQVVQNEVLASLARAHTVFASACGRLELASSAIEEARQTLASEESRFNLGEGTSRNVLDAQKDLTSATRRGISVAGTVADALVQLVYAAGQNPVGIIASQEVRYEEVSAEKEGE